MSLMFITSEAFQIQHPSANNVKKLSSNIRYVSNIDTVQDNETQDYYNSSAKLQYFSTAC